MIDFSDYIIKIVGSRKAKQKYYHLFCNNCGADKGYQLKSADKHPTCNKCAKLGISWSNETKQKMSVSAIGNDNSAKTHIKKIKVKKQRDKSTYVNPNIISVSPLQRYINHAVRSLLNHKLQRRSISRKGNRTFALLGYTAEEFIKHIESLWLPGMSWDNHGEWHIDHVTPDSWFTYSSLLDSEFKQSWSLENLRPVWAYDNLKKGNRYAG